MNGPVEPVEPVEPVDPVEPIDAADSADGVAAALSAKRDELEAELAHLSAAVPDTGGISFGKRVGDGTSVAVERLTQVAAHEQLGDTLAAVLRAQAKLQEGTYGVCDGCGKPIAAARLDALPWAAECIACASRR